MALAVVYTNFGGQIVHENRGGTERDYVPDTLGSTIALTDENETVTDTWEYWPYGEMESRTGTNPTPFTFVGTLGYFKDLVSNLTYVRARYLQTFTGQWMTRDRFWPDQSAFGYADQNPVQKVDPNGNLWGLIVVVVVVVVVASGCSKPKKPSGKTSKPCPKVTGDGCKELCDKAASGGIKGDQIDRAECVSCCVSLGILYKRLPAWVNVCQANCFANPKKVPCKC